MRLRTKVLSHALAGAAGALLAYFNDPDRGRARRAQARDQLVSRQHHAMAEADQRARYAKGQLQGVRARAQGFGEMDPVDDHVVKQGIEQAFARTGVDTSDVVIDVANGIAGLRGRVETVADRDHLQRDAATVPGVEMVESWLHLPGEPAPNKAESRRAG